VFGANDGDDTITDFDSGSDLISFFGEAAEFADLTIASDIDGNAVVAYEDTTITMQGVGAGDLSATDFLF
jgi:hypothetical protein